MYFTLKAPHSNLNIAGFPQARVCYCAKFKLHFGLG